MKRQDPEFIIVLILIIWMAIVDLAVIGIIAYAVINGEQ